MSRFILSCTLATTLAAVSGYAQATFGAGQRGMYGGISTGRMVGAIGDPGFASRLGATVSGLPQVSGATLPHGGAFSPPSFYGAPGPARGPAVRGHVGRGNRTVVVPFGVPVYYGGGYGYGYGYNGVPAPMEQSIVQQVQPSPSVIINQYYTPDVVRPSMQEYHDLPEAARRPESPSEDHGAVKVFPPAARTEAPAPEPAREEQKATITLLAFHDSTVVAAIGYWTQGDTLHYVTKTFAKHVAPVSTLDRALTEQLNRERSVEFSLEQLR